LQADTRLLFEQPATWPTTGSGWSCSLIRANRATCFALGTNGPVLGLGQGHGFNLWSSPDTSLRSSRRIWTAANWSRCSWCNPVLADVTVELDTIVGGVMFDDGTTIKTLTASDFNALGQSKVRFIRPATARRLCATRSRRFKALNCWAIRAEPGRRVMLPIPFTGFFDTLAPSDGERAG